MASAWLSRQPPVYPSWAGGPLVLKPEKGWHMRLLGVDIEITNIFKLASGEDLDKYAPFNVACACTAISDSSGESREEHRWYPDLRNRKSATDVHMAPSTARSVLYYLHAMQLDGFAICAWNGLGFDLRWLGYAADNMKLAAHVARKSYDPMFQFFCMTGFPVSLAAVAKGMGIEQVKAMSGAAAPVEWAAGNSAVVIDYCMGDVQMTNQVIHAIDRDGEVRWITAKGALRSVPMPKLLPAIECLTLPLPNVAWMDNPIPREKFTGWFNHGAEE